MATLISFRVGHVDAEVLKKEFGSAYVAQHFVDLDQYEVLVKTLNEGIPTEPFRGKSLPPVENRIGRRANLLQHSRERFTTQRIIVERKLRQWMRRPAT